MLLQLFAVLHGVVLRLESCRDFLKSSTYVRKLFRLIDYIQNGKVFLILKYDLHVSLKQKMLILLHLHQSVHCLLFVLADHFSFLVLLQGCNVMRLLEKCIHCDVSYKSKFCITLHKYVHLRNSERSNLLHCTKCNKNFVKFEVFECHKKFHQISKCTPQHEEQNNCHGKCKKVLD